ncbi:MAG TPA: hypothetical protein VEV37_04120 [Bryobacteraceae bacterium]|nr:hypothetical protein [Bryobacteraceae bacterium]
MPLPTLDRDPGDPAAALTDGGARGLWEIFAPRYDLRTSAGQWNKDLAAAEIVQPETVDVIFGRLDGAKIKLCSVLASLSSAPRVNPAHTPFDGTKLPINWRAGMSLRCHSENSSQ